MGERSSHLLLVINYLFRNTKQDYFCLSFDYTVTSPKVGSLKIQHLEATSPYSKEGIMKNIWLSVDSDERAGEWQSARVLIDGSGHWTVNWITVSLVQFFRRPFSPDGSKRLFW